MNPETNVLNEIADRSLAELSALPLSVLDDWIRQLAALKELVRGCDLSLQTALDQRYADCAHQLRLRAGKTTGTVRFEDDEFIVIADLPKRPEYDQGKLKTAVETLRTWGENPDDYVTLEIKVAEAKYNAWPPGIRQLFEPARTVRIGKPSYKLERIQAIERSASPYRSEAA